MHERLKWMLCLLSLVWALHRTSAAIMPKDDNSAPKGDVSRARRSPSGNVFLGMRGKKAALWDECNDADDPWDATSKEQFRGQAEMVDSAPFSHDRPVYGLKRLNNFMAMRGKKEPLDANEMRKTQRLDNDLQSFLDDKRSLKLGFTGMRGKKNPSDGERRRRPETKFFAMRGRRSKRRAFLGQRGKKWPCTREARAISADMDHTLQDNREAGSQTNL